MLQRYLEQTKTTVQVVLRNREIIFPVDHKKKGISTRRTVTAVLFTKDCGGRVETNKRKRHNK